MLAAATREALGLQLENAVVVFDEAHNLDHACVECLSCNFRLPTLNSCRDRLRDLSRIIRQQPSLETLATTRARSIGAIGGYREAELFGAPPTMLGDPNRSFPGNLRRPASFVWYMQRVVEYLHSKLESCQASTLEGCKSFLHEMERAEDDFAKPLRYVGLRLRLLLSSLGEALEILGDEMRRKLYNEGYDKAAIEERVQAAARAANDHSKDGCNRGGCGGCHH